MPVFRKDSKINDEDLIQGQNLIALVGILCFSETQFEAGKSGQHVQKTFEGVKERVQWGREMKHGES
jgi:hypothetical protein